MGRWQYGVQVAMEKDEARTQQCRMMRICGDNGVGDDGKSDNGLNGKRYGMKMV